MIVLALLLASKDAFMNCFAAFFELICYLCPNPAVLFRGSDVFSSID